MLRETMTRTIPVAMIATEAVCTERFHRFLGVRNVPPDMKWNAVQITASAISMASIECRPRWYQSHPAFAGASPPVAPVRMGELR